MPRYIAHVPTIVILSGITIGFLLGHQSFSLHTEFPVLKTCSGHFINQSELVQATLVEPVRGILDSNYIVLSHRQGTKLEKFWKSSPAPIWDIHFTDLDGDSQDELALCLYKEEPYDPNRDNRLHIYGWRSDSVHALWRGTYLSKPFEKVMFADIDGDSVQELLSLEHGRQTPEKKFLSVYRWNGFGFDFISDTAIDEHANSLNIPAGTRNILVSDSDERATTYHLAGNTIVRSQ
jgi:hypothetical protein